MVDLSVFSKEADDFILMQRGFSKIQALIRAFIGIFLVFSNYGFANSNHDALIDDHYRRGYELSESKQFSRALLELNLAMRHLRNFPQHPKRKEVENLIVRTKERLVVERYRQSEQSQQKADDHLLPTKFEPEHFKVNQVYGRVFARKIWKDRDQLAPKERLGEGRQVTTLPGGGVEIEESGSLGFILRAVDAGAFSLPSSSSVDLHSGSISICFKRPVANFEIGSRDENLQVSSGSPFALFAEISFGKAIQLSSLLGKISITDGDAVVSLFPGNRIEASMNGIRKMDELELGSHYLKSRIIGQFENPPIFYDQLSKQARIQISRIRVP